MENRIAKTLNISQRQVDAVLKLLADGATIPFIARYRKEATDSLDEVQIENIESEYKKLIDLAKRKETIFERLLELNITDKILIGKINDCYDLKVLEDLYLPYKPKRKTKASMARERGLEPLAKTLMAQRDDHVERAAERYAQKNLSVDEALQGARDIIAEWVSEHAYTRNQLRRMYQNSAVLVSKVIEKKKSEASKYNDYFEFDQLIKRIPSHRLLAILRAEKEGLLKVKIDIDKELAIQKTEDNFIKSNGAAADQIKQAIEDGFKRLLVPSLETELRHDAKEKADDEAIGIFVNNLSQLLMAPPLGAKRTMALDPGFRSGCKVVCLNEQGNLIDYVTIFPHPPQSQTRQAEQILLEAIHKNKIETIAVGNGTAGRETERFVKSILPKDSGIEVYLVNEDGASIYSASAVGREEFPDLDLTVRGSISIGRRLIDPLAELVKIEPKSIGVGQYQHDVAQDKLKASLENTISYAVNKVGVNLNTASQHLLRHVSGVGPKLAQNIVDYRNEHGTFKNRSALKKVKGLGAKAFEQAAGFLRIKNGDNPLDASAVHPERYGVVKRIAKKSKIDLDDLIGNKQAVSDINLRDFVTDKVGLPTLIDIASELQKPGLDPRGTAKAIQFDDAIQVIEDLKVGMTLKGKITNLTKFGAFVDLGIKENGLIHKSQIADRFINDPAEVLSLEQEVTVRVLEIDLERKRIQLSMRK